MNALQELISRLERVQAVSPSDAPFAEVIRQMYQLSASLTKKRMKEGSIDFDSAEAKFEFDAHGKPIKIIKESAIREPSVSGRIYVIGKQSCGAPILD